MRCTTPFPSAPKVDQYGLLVRALTDDLKLLFEITDLGVDWPPNPINSVCARYGSVSRQRTGVQRNCGSTVPSMVSKRASLFLLVRNRSISNEPWVKPMKATILIAD